MPKNSSGAADATRAAEGVARYVRVDGEWFCIDPDVTVTTTPFAADVGVAPKRGTPAAACYDCGRGYGDEFGFPDLVVPHDVWQKISPKGNEGGLLCPSCMCRRAHASGLSGIPARFTSGPFSHD